jgi:RNA polymerase sigma-70 factor (ECF subfamily)
MAVLGPGESASRESTTRQWAEFQEILDLAREGSDTALGEILQGCRQYLLLVANCELEPELRVKSAASDLVQDTFVSAGEHFRSFRGATAEEMLAWLRQILLHHLASDRRRFFTTKKRQAHRDRSLDSLHDSAIRLQLAADTRTPSRHAIHGEERQMIERALQRLDDRQRLVIQLRHREQLRFEEIAQRMEISTSAARRLWARALDRLRRELPTSCLGASEEDWP